ncbi:hypothetical protein LINPERHAP2_LOCUS14164, partial [Linum perenne]
MLIRPILDDSTPPPQLGPINRRFPTQWTTRHPQTIRPILHTHTLHAKGCSHPPYPGAHARYLLTALKANP